jgi:hypothetical protein
MAATLLAMGETSAAVTWWPRNYFRHSENTLLLVDDQSCRLELLEQGLQVPHVLGGGAAPDDNIIQVDEYEVQPG